MLKRKGSASGSDQVFIKGLASETKCRHSIIVLCIYVYIHRNTVIASYEPIVYYSLYIYIYIYIYINVYL